MTKKENENPINQQFIKHIGVANTAKIVAVLMRKTKQMIWFSHFIAVII